MRTPRTAFVINKVYVGVYYTDPPNRGVQFHLQPLTSFLAGKARGFWCAGVHLIRFRQFIEKVFHSFFASLLPR
jgi:hypothetical protein